MRVDFVSLGPLLVGALVLSLCGWGVDGQSCPSGAYTYCVQEGGQCNIPSTVSSGYVSYGAGGQWVLHPFTNGNGNSGTDVHLGCDNTLTDVARGSTKHCCYIAADHGWDSEPYTDLWASEDCGRYATSSTIEGLRYGNSNIYIYQAFQGSRGPRVCNDDFGDPLKGAGKKTQSEHTSPLGVAKLKKVSSWVSCAQEGQTCSGLDRTAATWVRYGDNNQWRYKMVIASSVTCNNDVFGDPLPGAGKYCYKSKSIVEFANIAGYWNSVIICGGGCSSTYTMTKGVTKHEESSLSEEFAWSLEVSASASYGFASGSMTASVSGAVVSSSLSSVTKTAEVSMSVTCADTTDQRMWQFRTSATENNLVSGLTNFEIGSLNIWCVSDDGMTPQCPPGYCQGADCQTCSSAISYSPANPRMVEWASLMNSQTAMVARDAEWPLWQLLALMAAVALATLLLSAAVRSACKCCCAERTKTAKTAQQAGQSVQYAFVTATEA